MMASGLWSGFKRGIFGCALCIVSPLIVLSWLEVRIFGPKTERVFSAAKEFLALLPTPLGQFIRAAYYWACCRGVSWDVCISLGSMIAHRDVVIGRRVVIGCYSIIGQAHIEDDVLIGSKVSIVSGKYEHGRPSARREGMSDREELETIRIGANSWIGEQAVILAAVGRDCTVAAGAALFREAPDHSTFAGNPARRVDLVSGR